MNRNEYLYFCMHKMVIKHRKRVICLKRVIGFALFWVAVGMILALILPNTFVEVLCIILCILAGYNLFCC
ncbi:MAG: hypothetical protein K1W34_15815 [Lachnospiraceae bacterium]